MPKILSDEQVARYHRDNFFAAFPALPAEKAREYRSKLEAYEARHGGAPLEPWRYRKLHVGEAWCAELIRIPAVLDAVEDVIGPDILCFNATFFIKNPNTPHVTAWHQDSTYFGLRPHEHVSAWVALSNASQEAGCISFIPGSSRLGQLRHDRVDALTSVNHGSQQIVEALDDSDAALVPLRIGECSLHHTLVVHSSGPNSSEDRRIGIGISYIPTHVRHIGSYRMGATLVRGEDRYGHFELESDPREHDADTNARNHEAAYRRYREGYDEQMMKHREYNTTGQAEGYAP